MHICVEICREYYIENYNFIKIDQIFVKPNSRQNKY